MQTMLSEDLPFFADNLYWYFIFFTSDNVPLNIHVDKNIVATDKKVHVILNSVFVVLMVHQCTKANPHTFLK